VAFSPDGKTIASGSRDQTVRIWEAGSGRLLMVLQGHTDWVRSVAFSPLGDLIVSGSQDQSVRLWEVSSGTCLMSLQEHAGWVCSVAFSPDGSAFVSCGYDGIIKSWDARTGICCVSMRSDRPYERMNIAGARGLTEMQRVTLKALGAIEDAGETA